MVMLKVMQRVADKYGVDALFTKGYGTYVKEGLETFEKFATDGTTGPVTYAQRDHKGGTGLVWYQPTPPGEITKIQDFMFPPPLTEEEYDWKFWVEIEK